MRRLALTLFVAITAGCSPKLQPVEKMEIRTEYRDRLVHDTVQVEMPPKMEEKVITVERTSHLENEWASSDASVDSLGMLHHSLKTLPHVISVPVTIPVHDTVRLEAKTVTLTKYVEQPLKGYQKALILAGIVFIACAIVRLIKIFK